jgi:hypothetical protein
MMARPIKDYMRTPGLTRMERKRDGHVPSTPPPSLFLSGNTPTARVLHILGKENLDN